MTKPEFTSALTKLQAQAHAIEEAIYRLRYPDGIDASGHGAGSLRRLLANGDHGNPLGYSTTESIEAAQTLLQSICHQLAATAEWHGCRLPIVEPVHERVRRQALDCGGDIREHEPALDKARIYTPSEGDAVFSPTADDLDEAAEQRAVCAAVDREMVVAASKSPDW